MTKFSCWSLEFLFRKKDDNAQKIRENVVVDKNNAYVIYEWPQSKCPSCQDGPITKRNLKPDTELTPLMDLFQGLLDDLEEAGKTFVLF